jgi:hypothetical protein
MITVASGNFTAHLNIGIFMGSPSHIQELKQATISSRTITIKTNVSDSTSGTVSDVRSTQTILKRTMQEMKQPLHYSVLFNRDINWQTDSRH